MFIIFPCQLVWQEIKIVSYFISSHYPIPPSHPAVAGCEGGM
ncbi:MAG: hypothetical protein WAX69_26290 [Victivallales bacterium]